MRPAATARNCGLKWPSGCDEGYAAKHWCGQDRRRGVSAKSSLSPKSCGNWLTRPKPHLPARPDLIERDDSSLRNLVARVGPPGEARNPPFRVIHIPDLTAVDPKRPSACLTR